MPPQATNSEKLRVAIVEDRRQTRESLTFLINEAPDLTCVAAVASAEEALEQLPAATPEVVILDIQLAGEMNGIDCIKALRESLPESKIVMFTASHDAPSVARCLAHGAAGYIHKGNSLERLPQSIREAAEGGAPMSADVARLVCGFFQAIDSVLHEWEKLTPREHDVLKLMTQGFIKKEIADSLSISEATVRTHTSHIYEKLQVNSRGNAVAKAVPLAALEWLKPSCRTGLSTQPNKPKEI
jgi:NarL family two-component system response regulator LiaR